MSIIEAILLGCLQGLTEFIPVSSSAHLRVIPALLGQADPGVAFTAVIQLGSLLALILYFRLPLAAVSSALLALIRGREYVAADLNLLRALAVGTVPLCLGGLAFKVLLDVPDLPLRSLYVVGFASVAMGLVLLLAELIGRRIKHLEDISAWDALVIGCAQMLALVPGASRSGSTIAFALMADYTRQDAARFSFLLAIPAIAISGLLELGSLFESGLAPGKWVALLLAFAASAVSSHLSIAWLLKFLSTRSTLVFIIYRLVFGALVVSLTHSGAIR